MKKTRIIMFALSIMMVLCMAVSCAPEEAEKPFVSGLGTKINAYQEYGGWIYYIDYANTAYLYKIKSNGKKRTLIIDDPVYSFIIYENKIFYTNWKFYVYTSNIDGSNDKKLYSLNEDLLADGTIRAEKMQIANGWIYALYLGELYKFKTDGSQRTIVKLESFHDFCIDGDMMYYYSIPLKEREKGYRWQMEAEDTEPQPLLQEPARFLDYDEDWIYYICMEDDDIYKVSFDGNEKYKIIECNATYIKAFGDWIYYEQTGDNKGLYKIRKDGSDNTYIREIGDWEIGGEEDTFIIDNWVSYYGVFDQYLLCYWDEISAIKLGESSEAEELTHDIISEWPDTTIYE